MGQVALLQELCCNADSNFCWFVTAEREAQGTDKSSSLLRQQALKGHKFSLKNSALGPAAYDPNKTKTILPYGAGEHGPIRFMPPRNAKNKTAIWSPGQGARQILGTVAHNPFWQASKPFFTLVINMHNKGQRDKHPHQGLTYMAGTEDVHFWPRRLP